MAGEQSPPVTRCGLPDELYGTDRHGVDSWAIVTASLLIVE
jgi:hypothetical protein